MGKGEPTGWITVNGKRVPIFEGESKAEAVKRSIDSDQDKKERQIAANKEQSDKLNDKSSNVSPKAKKSAELARQQLNFNRPGEYAEITDRHWGKTAGVSNERMAEIMSMQDPKYDYEYRKETEKTTAFGHNTTVEHHRMYRVPK